MIKLKTFVSFIWRSKLMLLCRKCFGTILDIFYLLPLVFRALLITPLLLIFCLELISQYHKPPIAKIIKAVDSSRIQHPNYNNTALVALANLRQLPPVEQHFIIDNLTANLWPVSKWKKQLSEYNNAILCLGESHLETTREFMAEQLFSTFLIDHLYLEATAKRLKLIIEKVHSNSKYYPLLDADILQVIRTALKQNPQLNIYPIEASVQQMRDAKQGIGSREISIFNNFLNQDKPHSKRLVLIGGLHCANKAHWLFARMQKHYQEAQLINTQIFNEHQDGPIEAFVYFLDELALAQGDFVIADTAAFSTQIMRWFALSQRVTFKPYQSIIIYRNK